MPRTIIASTICIFAVLTASEPAPATLPDAAAATPAPSAATDAAKPPAPALETFILEDHRIFTGTYDADRRLLSVPGPTAFAFALDPARIASRSPATDEEIAAVKPRIVEPLTPEQQAARRAYWEQQQAQEAKDKADREARAAKLQAEQAEADRKRKAEQAQRRAEAEARAAAAAAASTPAPPPSGGGY